MKFGLYICPSGEFADVRVLADLATLAEDGGWDGLFLYDQIQPFGPGSYEPLMDPWGALMAIALSTSGFVWALWSPHLRGEGLRRWRGRA